MRMGRMAISIDKDLPFFYKKLRPGGREERMTMKMLRLGQALSRKTIGGTWWVFALFLLAAAGVVRADDFTYTNNPNDTVTITGYTGTSSVVAIPATNSDGKAIARIGDNAFFSRTNLTSITIGSNVTDIGSAMPVTKLEASERR